jgi:hypothetical protein
MSDEVRKLARELTRYCDVMLAKIDAVAERIEAQSRTINPQIQTTAEAQASCEANMSDGERQFGG